MDEQDRAAIVDDLLVRLEERGVPQGTWLVEIEQAHRSLIEVSGLLSRLRSALIRQAEAESSLPGS